MSSRSSVTEARIGRVPGQAQAGRGEHPAQVRQAVAFALVAVELELQADRGPDLLEQEEPAVVRGDEQEAAAGLEDAADLGQGRGVVVDVLEIVEADDLVEGAVRKGRAGMPIWTRSSPRRARLECRLVRSRSVETQVPPFWRRK